MAHIGKDDQAKPRATGAGLKGHLTAEDVYAHHRRVMVDRGLEPLSALRLGRALVEYGAHRRPKWNRDKGERGYMVKGWVF